jgi:hypothetical protein
MVEVRYRITWQLAISIVLVITIALIPVIIYFLDYKQIFLYIMSAIIGWTVLALIAIMGAFLLGMAVGHRISSKSEFTPFEIEMIKMKEEVNHLKDILHRHNQHHVEERKQVDHAGTKTGPKEPKGKATMFEEEPDLEGPTAHGTEMKPVGNVRCGRCKKMVPVYSKERPLEIECTNCGKIGVLK